MTKSATTSENKNLGTTKNFATKKPATTKAPRIAKAKVEKIETLETIETPILKIKVSKTQKSIETLMKVSGSSKENLMTFLVVNLASRKAKVNLNKVLTSLTIKVASGTLSIQNEDKDHFSIEMLNTIVEQSKVDFDKLQMFVINDLARKEKVALRTYFKDLFFNVATNKKNIVARINK